MVKQEYPREDYAEVKPAYELGGKQYYYLCVDPQEQEDGNIIAIMDVYDHRPTTEDKTALYNAWLAMEQRVKVADIMAYDVSDNVNRFFVNGVQTWLDKATRVGLQNSLHVEQEAGHETTTLYLNGTAIVLPVAQAIAIMDTLELYAIDCYRCTEEHKATVNAMTVIEEVNRFDYTAGYPEAPSFNV